MAAPRGFTEYQPVSAKGGAPDLPPQMSGMCCGMEHLCCEAADAQKSVNWTYVGEGRGQFDRGTTINFVGNGLGNYEKEKKVEHYGQKVRPVFYGVGALIGVMGLIYFVNELSAYYLSGDLDTTTLAPPGLMPVPVVTGMTGVTDVATAAFNCHAPGQWSLLQAQWCCQNQHVGCPTAAPQQMVQPPPPPPPPAAPHPFLHAAAAPAIAAMRTAPTTHTVPYVPYDCTTALSNWQMAWATGKKAWCCQNAGKGCPVG